MGDEDFKEHVDWLRFKISHEAADVIENGIKRLESRANLLAEKLRVVEELLREGWRAGCFAGALKEKVSVFLTDIAKKAEG